MHGTFSLAFKGGLLILLIVASGSILGSLFKKCLQAGIFSFLMEACGAIPTAVGFLFLHVV